MKKIWLFLIISFGLIISIYPEEITILVWDLNKNENIEYDNRIFSPIYDILNNFYEVTDFGDILDIYDSEFYDYANQNNFDYIFLYNVLDEVIKIKNVDEKFRTLSEYVYVIDEINIFSIKYEIINKMIEVINESPVVSRYQEITESENFKKIDMNMKKHVVNLMLYQIYDDENAFFDSEKYFINTLIIERESIKAVYFNELNSVFTISDYYIEKSFENSLNDLTLSHIFRDMLKYIDNEVIYNFLLYAIDKSNIFLFNTDDKYYSFINENLEEIIENINEHYLSMWLEGFIQHSIKFYPEDTHRIFEIMHPYFEKSIDYGEFIEEFS